MEKILSALNEAIKLISELNQGRSEELDELRKKYNVPTEDGDTVNTNASRIFNHIKNDGLDEGKWNAPSSQTERYEALSKARASTWRDGYFLVRDGNLAYPYINKSGKAMVSGIRAVRTRSAQHGPRQVFEVADRVMERIRKEEEKESKKAKKANKKK